MVVIEIVLAGAAALATLLWLGISFQSWLRRDQLMLRVGTHLVNLPFSESELMGALETAFQRANSAGAGARMAAYEVGDDIAKPKPFKENLGGAAGEVLISTMAPLLLQFLVMASERMFRSTVIETDLTLDEKSLTWIATCCKGRERVARIVVTRDASARHDLDEMAWELACRMLVEATKHPGAGLTVGTQDWGAFQAHCEGMSLWLDPQRTREMEAEAGRLLDQAVERDGRYVAALYNQAAFTYNKQLTWSSTDQALKQFLEAYRITAEQGSMPDPTRRKLRGYACVGAARCLAMGAHRYRRADHRKVERARRFGDEALELLGRTPKALYASAFTWHCTEALDGLKRGRQLYEEILTAHPRDTFPVVLNNLAYVCHRAGEEIEQVEGPAAARDWYEEALLRARQAHEGIEDLHRVKMMTYTNMGAAQRLLGLHEEALESYRKALKYDPLRERAHEPVYIEALCEFAEVLIDQALTEDDRERLSAGLGLHEEALGRATDPGHVGKLSAQTGRCIVRKRPALSSELERLIDLCEEADRADYIGVWMDGLRSRLLGSRDGG